jgi:hypothetical protein
MSAGHEEDIATYLTIDGRVFLAPQYIIAFDRDLQNGGTCPDFVALDFRFQEVVVVEVTTSVNWRSLAQNVRDREARWFNPISRRLKEFSLPGAEWKIRFLGFLREANVEPAKSQFKDENDVTFFAIEDATFLWKYWDKRIKDGLPR